MEHYLKPFGIIQGGFFYKQLYDPIVTQSSSKQNYTPDPGNSSLPCRNLAWLLSLSTRVAVGLLALNSPICSISLRCRDFSVPGAFRQLQLTRIRKQAVCRDARIVRAARGKPRILGTSARPLIADALSIRVGMTYNAASIYSYQYQDGTGGSTPTPGGLRGPLGDNYLYPHFQIDAQGSYRLKYGFTVMAYGLNLNNEVFGFYNGQPQYMVQREYYGPTFAFGYALVADAREVAFASARAESLQHPTAGMQLDSSAHAGRSSGPHR